MASIEYARLRDLWTKYQSGYPGIDATKIRDATSMDNVVVYDAQGRPSTAPDFEDNLRRPWQNTSAWADYGVGKGFIRSEDRLAASVELWETGVLFYEPGRTRSFAGLESPDAATVQALNQNSDPVLFSGGAMTGNFVPSSLGSGTVLLDGEITRSSLPTRELGERVAGAGGYLPVSQTYAAQFAPGAPQAGGLPLWVWVLLIGAGVYFLTKGQP